MAGSGGKLDGFFFANPTASIAVVRSLLAEVCALLEYYQENPPLRGHPAPSAGGSAGEPSSHAAFATTPAAMGGGDYLQRLCSSFSRHAERGRRSSFLKSLLTIPSRGSAKKLPNAEGSHRSAWIDLETVASTAIFLPSDPLMSHEMQLHLIHRRILFKALQRLFFSVLLLVFNVEEARMRPESYTELYAPYFAAAGGEAALSGKADDETESGVSNALKGKRYRYLEECFFFMAFIYAELDGLSKHGYEACTAALMYAPHNAALWMLRAVFLARLKSYKAALQDLDIATTLTETRLNQLRLALVESKTPPHLQRGDNSSKKSKVSHSIPVEGKAHPHASQSSVAGNESSMELKEDIEACEQRLQDIHRQRLGVNDLVGELQGRRAMQKSLNLLGSTMGGALSHWASLQ
ncbi:unnamed protein product [Phytomonas sp. EM1]|nr:unnamed protein product [Phytomonas sp. EM1]|eukprot:CCW61092.1 unnamed protein product [Phytomonas sp. isolate EM1]